MVLVARASYRTSLRGPEAGDVDEGDLTRTGDWFACVGVRAIRSTCRRRDRCTHAPNARLAADAELGYRAAPSPRTGDLRYSRRRIRGDECMKRWMKLFIVALGIVCCTAVTAVATIDSPSSAQNGASRSLITEQFSAAPVQAGSSCSIPADPISGCAACAITCPVGQAAVCEYGERACNPSGTNCRCSRPARCFCRK
jgi:hypothetical protein